MPKSFVKIDVGVADGVAALQAAKTKGERRQNAYMLGWCSARFVATRDMKHIDSACGYEEYQRDFRASGCDRELMASEPTFGECITKRTLRMLRTAWDSGYRPRDAVTMTEDQIARARKMIVDANRDTRGTYGLYVAAVLAWIDKKTIGNGEDLKAAARDYELPSCDDGSTAFSDSKANLHMLSQWQPPK